MKRHFDSNMILRMLDDTIEHCGKEGLPLRSIELTPEEWAAFKWALAAVPGWNATDDELETKTTSYRGIKIFEGEPA